MTNKTRHDCGNSICALLEEARYLKNAALLIFKVRFAHYDDDIQNAILEKVERTINDTIEKMKILDKASDYHVFTPREEDDGPDKSTD